MKWAALRHRQRLRCTFSPAMLIRQPDITRQSWRTWQKQPKAWGRWQRNRSGRDGATRARRIVAALRHARSGNSATTGRVDAAWGAAWDKVLRAEIVPAPLVGLPLTSGVSPACERVHRLDRSVRCLPAFDLSFQLPHYLFQVRVTNRPVNRSSATSLS
jgi:hypothetical protein